MYVFIGGLCAVSYEIILSYLPFLRQHNDNISLQFVHTALSSHIAYGVTEYNPIDVCQ